MAESQATKILCIEHNPALLHKMHADLKRRYEFHTADTDEQALDMLRKQGPYEAVLTDAPENSLLLEEIRNLSPASARILITQRDDENLARRARETGQIFRYIMQPCTTDELVSAIDMAVVDNTCIVHKMQLEQEARKFLSAGDHLRSAMMFDPELGIGSPEAMEMELEYSHNIALRYKRTYSIAVFDLDNYSDYVVHYGRKAARLAHKLMAEHIRHTCRAADRIYRCGTGTPVLLILPETGCDGANVLSERIVKSFFERNIPNTKSIHNFLSLSGALAAYEPNTPEKPANWQSILDEVMLYLQVAQGQSGNCVMRCDCIVEEAS